MNKKDIIIVLICAIVLVVSGIVIAGSADPKIMVVNKAVNGKPAVDYLDEDDMDTDSNGAVASQQSIKAYVDNESDYINGGGKGDDVVYIDNVSDLSTWSGAAAGSSYFQTEAGKTYIVDVQSIVTSGTAPTSGVSTQAFSAVSAMLPLATTTSTKKFVQIVLAQVGSGTSAAPIPFTCEIWPAVPTGTTMFRGSGALKTSQNMLGAAAGVTPYTVGVTGYHNLNDIGESMKYGLVYNAAVSAYVLNGQAATNY